MKEKAIVYPFDLQFEPILRHKSLLPDYDIIGLISPEGWGLTGKNVFYSARGNTSSICINNDFEDCLNLCDTVVFNESDSTLDFYEFIYPKINISIQNKKNIIMLMRIENELENEIAVRCKENDVYFKCYNHLERFSHFYNYQAVNETLCDINTPVVFILGTSERTSKFEIQLSLREHYINMGYRLSQIGSRNYCEFLGFKSFPDFMFNSNITETNKVILFNRYVKEIEIIERPDIIIICIPGGIMPFNNIFTNKFGILAFEISQAVIPDAAVFSTLYDDYRPEYFESIAATVRHKLGYDIDCFNLTDVQFDWSKAKEEKRMVYTTLSSNFIDNKKLMYSILNTPVYNILNSTDALKMGSYITDKLADYGCVRSV